jgi:curved DNA-binding protein CbpA
MPSPMPVRPADNPDPFVLLGVSEYSSDEVINAAWRRQIRLCHPDHATDDADRERRLAKSIALNQAHDILLDPEQKARAILDRRRAAGEAAPWAAEAPSPGPQTEHRQQPSAPSSPPRRTWAGTSWSSYRAGGHPEARDSWTYTESPPSAAAPEPAKERRPSSVALVRPDWPAPVRIVAMTVRILAETAWMAISSVGRLIVHRSYWIDDLDDF